MITVKMNTTLEPIIEMQMMKPLEVGRIIEGTYAGIIVMRTADTASFEAMNLSFPGPNKCWTGRPSLKVQLFKKGAQFTITVTE